MNSNIFYTKKFFVLLLTGQHKRLWNEIHVRLYRAYWTIIFKAKLLFDSKLKRPPLSITLVTSYPLASDSPDHLHPKGTAYSFTNRKFILKMDGLITSSEKSMLDLGCAGGQVVVDFLDLGWNAVGIEGSDYCIRHNYKNWRKHGNSNLFCADITKPFSVYQNQKPMLFDLITAWEVLEHIKKEDLAIVFFNILSHLKNGGYFIASTTSTPDIHEGVDLHQTKWTNEQWNTYIELNWHQFFPVDLQLKLYQCVRCNFNEPSTLIFQKLG